PGLLVLAADLDGVDSFAIDGNLGADGSGSADGTELQVTSGIRYRGFVKRVFNAYDPSVNHLIIIEDLPGIAQSFATNTNDDHHQVSGLRANSRLYYLLYAGQNGSYI